MADMSMETGKVTIPAAKETIGQVALSPRKTGRPPIDADKQAQLPALLLDAGASSAA